MIISPKHLKHIFSVIVDYVNKRKWTHKLLNLGISKTDLNKL